MFGLGTVINGVGILLGGILGFLFGKLLNERIQDGLCKACGVATVFLAIAGAMEGMLSVEEGGITSGKSLLVILCLVLGTLAGELLNIEGWFEKFGIFLRQKTGNARDQKFVEAFLTATFTVCIGAMAIVGAIKDGLSGDYSILLAKTILDTIIVMALTATMGKGAVFSAIPVVVLQGIVTLSAKVIEPVMTEAALNNISTVGSVLIFCVGINLVFGNKIRVANMVPALIFAVIAAFLPFSL